MPMPILLAIAPFGLLLTSTTPHASTVTARRAMSPVAVDAQQAASLTSALNFNDPNVQASFGAIAAALIGGVAYANNKKEPSTESSAPPSAAPVTVAVAVAARPAPPKEWPAVGGGSAPHRMRGPWPKEPAREQWEPPPGWRKPSKPVTSWYDRGDRLVPAKPAAPAPAAPPPPPPTSKLPNMASMWDQFVASFKGQSTPASSPTAEALKKWPAVGGGSAPHRMRGPWPKEPAREQWEPPPGWKPPSPPAAPVSSVVSWYDSGKRL